MNSETLSDARIRTRASRTHTILEELKASVLRGLVEEGSSEYDIEGSDVIDLLPSVSLDVKKATISSALFRALQVDELRAYEVLNATRNLRALTELTIDLDTFFDRPSSAQARNLVDKWSSLGTQRREIDRWLYIPKRFPHSGAFGTAKEATMGAIVLAMDFEWRTASGGAMVPLEAGFSRLDTLSLEEAVSHLALEREWRNPRPYSSRKTAQNISPDFVCGITIEHKDLASLAQGVHSEIQAAHKAAADAGRVLVLAFHDGRCDKRILKESFGYDVSNCKIVDTSDIFCELENRHSRLSLTDAVRWTTGESVEGSSHNAGNDAHAITKLIKGLLLSYSHVSCARWAVLGAHSLIQVPSSDDMRSPDAPRVLFS